MFIIVVVLEVYKIIFQNTKSLVGIDCGGRSMQKGKQSVL